MTLLQAYVADKQQQHSKDDQSGKAPKGSTGSHGPSDANSSAPSGQDLLAEALLRVCALDYEPSDQTLLLESGLIKVSSDSNLHFDI